MIKKLSELNENQLNQAIDVFIDGFSYIFSKAIRTNKENLHKLFKNSFNYNMTFAYLQDGEAIGFMGIATYEKRPIKLNREIFMEILGEKFNTKISFNAMSAALEKVNVDSSELIYIDYIATQAEHRSKGVGIKLIEYVRDTMGYKYIKLEVLSKNDRAIKFYERLGFKVVKIRTDLMMQMNGFGKPIVMQMEV